MTTREAANAGDDGFIILFDHGFHECPRIGKLAFLPYPENLY
jgi:hypothetical protein